MNQRRERRERRDVMLAYPFEERRLEKWPKPWLVQPKYDGLRCRAITSPDEVTLYSSTGLEIDTVPHINNSLHEALSTPVILDGELYLHKEHGFQELTSIVNRGRGGLHPNYHKVKFIVFDKVSQDNQVSRLAQLMMLDLGEFTEWTHTQAAFDLSGVEGALQYFTEEGYEGIILRNPEGLYKPKRSTDMMKWKPRRSDFYTIIGFQEEKDIYGQPKNALGALEVLDEYGASFFVGTGFTREQRNLYWNNPALLGRLVEVKYQALTKAGVPRFPVFSKVVE